MRDHDKLRLRAHLPHHIGKAIDVGFIERRVHLVQNAEWAGLETKQSNEKCERRKRLFAAGQQKDILQLLPRWLSDNFDACIPFAGLFQKPELAMAPAK